MASQASVSVVAPGRPSNVVPLRADVTSLPGYIAADQMRPVVDPYTNGNEEFRRALTDRACRLDPSRAAANGMTC